jgi:hypothetical protein
VSYTIVSARYANPENTAAEVITADAGAVLFSQADTPKEWAALKKRGGVLPYAAPAPSRTFKFLAFMDLFTESEQLALARAAMADAAVKLWYDRALGAEFVDLDDSRTIAGVGVMAALGLLTNARAEAVLDGLAP